MPYLVSEIFDLLDKRLHALSLRGRHVVVEAEILLDLLVVVIGQLHFRGLNLKKERFTSV